MPTKKPRSRPCAHSFLPAVGLVVVAAEPLPAAVPVVVLVVLLVVVVEGRDGGRTVLLVPHRAEIGEEMSKLGNF